MVNTAKIKGRIVEKGKTIQLIAPKIPCSPYTLGQKIANESPMNLEEASILCEELDITMEEFEEFFLQKKLQKCNKKFYKNFKKTFDK